jgi:hypothetical protein
VPKSSNRKNDTRRANRDRRQRLEELRRQQRSAERRKNFIFAGSAILIAIGLIAAAVIPAYLHDKHQKDKVKELTKVKQLAPTAAETAAGCTGVHQDAVSPAGVHVTTPIDYSKEPYGDTEGGTPPIPPSGGRHNPVSLGDTVRFYPLSEKPRPERAVHNLEHGYIVAWYDSKLPAADVTTLKTMASTLQRFLVVGWYQSELPAGKHLVLTSWGRTERCGTANVNVIKNFINNHVDSDLAPEKGFPAIQGADNYPPGTLPGANAPTPAATAPTSSTTTPTTKPSPTSTKKKKK